MSLTDIVSGMNVTIYPQIALVISLVTFLGVVVYVMLRPKREIDRQARLPLENDDPPRRAAAPRRVAHRS
ncbi:MAG: cbb3-type cytochrome c oxidase subunit 3 [Phycisphaerae bacterium]|jgi:cbb3-type cytochrome oxidase subunit 3